MSTFEQLRTACECCEGVTRLTPAAMLNRPGLPEIAYRAGTHARFKTSMLAAISGTEALRALTTRKDEDYTIALVDAWAVVLDVLTFYQERIANEAFLRTALQRRSLLELARLIGYELNPGVAADAMLAFILDASPGSPREVTIAAGLPTQSLPTKEEVPQTFETSEEFLARSAWSELKPRLTHPQLIDSTTRRLYVAGLAANLRLGDPMLLVTGDDSSEQEFLKVAGLKTDPEINWTEVTLEGEALEPKPYVPPNKNFDSLTIAMDSSLNEVVASVQANIVSTSELQQILFLSGYQTNEFTDSLNNDLATPPESPTPSAPGLYALRVTAAPFGHNAPKWDTTPKDWREPKTDPPTVPFENDWEGQSITRTSQGGDLSEDRSTVLLEQSFPELIGGQWIVLTGTFQVASEDFRVYQIQSVSETSVADYGLSGKSSRLVLKPAPGENAKPIADLFSYKFRETTIHTSSDYLELAELPIDTIEAGAETLELETVVPDLLPGHRLILVGERLGEEAGVTGAEEIELSDVGQGAFTTLVFKNPLKFGYQRDTVTLYANVVAATHGESRNEILGGGDAAMAFQQMKLSKSPLTYVSAPVPSGGVSTLELRVNDILWKEAANPLELRPDDRQYTLRLDDDGDTHVLFGDGVNGSRLPTGTENVTAKYRSGIGAVGLVDAERISLLPRKPLGVRSVTNPIATSGAQDPETRDEARDNAPLTVLTLDRVVSLQDYEDFARAFSGIGKAKAEWIWRGGSRIVYLTVAGVDGADLSSDKVADLITAINNARAPHQPWEVAPYEKLLFQIEAELHVHPDYIADIVLSSVEQKLRDTFSFSARTFADRVAESETLAVMQSVDGVESVVLKNLSYVLDSGGNAKDEFGLPCRGALFDTTTRVLHPAQLLTLSPTPLDLEVME
jgi:hypothetical protein